MGFRDEGQKRGVACVGVVRGHSHRDQPINSILFGGLSNKHQRTRYTIGEAPSLSRKLNRGKWDATSMMRCASLLRPMRIRSSVTYHVSCLDPECSSHSAHTPIPSFDPACVKVQSQRSAPKLTHMGSG